MHVEAKDKGQHPLLGQCKVIVHVTDMNDNYPDITVKSYKSTVNENIPVGTVIAIVGISDRDTGDNGKVSLSINQKLPFVLNKSSDVLYELVVSKPLDREQVAEYDITLVVTDGGTPSLSDNETITLHLLDVNDNAPLFPQSFYTIPVMENNAPGALLSSLTAFDPDLHENQYLVYFIIEKEIVNTSIVRNQCPAKRLLQVGNSVISERNSTIADSTLVSNDAYWYSLFLAETRKGKLVVRQPVPKAGSRYIVSSIPRSTGLTETSDSAASTLQHWRRYVSVFLIFSAVLNTAYAVTHYSIPEEMEEGSVVANLAADLSLDVKTLSKRKMRLDIISNKKYLDVNKETGELYIVEKMDREYLCPAKTSCFLKMEAIIENPQRIFYIEIEIMDINDNAPHFRRDTINLDISEATQGGERFSVNNAVDPDVGSNSVKTYLLSENEHFTIEIQTGRDGSKFADLILKSVLDREEQAVHNLILTAVDGGVPARSGTASIVVRVLDTNDNAPKFDKDNYKIDIMENSPIGSLVVKLNATDLDEGTNSEIIYSYSLYTSEKTQQTFHLNPNNGEITVKEMINYEDFRIYDMEVIATDKGPNSLSGQCKLTILVTDMNDNHPEISIKSFQSPVKEDIAVDTVIAVVSVSDKDSGENGIVDIHIADTLPFALRESSDNYYELVVSQPLDREKIPEYDITFTVTDRGFPPLSDNETMTLELLDVNDNVPQFPQSFYTIPVMENNAPGALLSSLTAFDPDLHENQYLVYFIIEKEICQKPKPSKAAPPSRNSVISERNSTIADSTLVSNDAYWYSLFLAETRKGKLVVRQPVPKAGSRYIVSSIPRSTGLTETSDSAASTLQLPGHKNMTMEAHRSAEHWRRYVSVFLLFSTALNTVYAVTHYSIPEELKEGSVVANLAADLGLDVQELSRRKMRLDVIANKKYLDVNKETGELYIVEKIDREYLCISKTTCFLKLDATIENPIRMFNIELEILDINDNAPHFRRDTMHLDIAESTPAGERFSLNNAVDPDIGTNSIKTYYLGESEHFNIEIQTGRDGSKFTDLILKKALDREEQSVHNLILTAVDGGVPSRTGTANIIVRVLDTNDNAPKFDRESYNIDIMENSPIGRVVVKLNATDLDEGSNSEIVYSFSLYTSEKTQETFNLNPNTGEITVKEMINYEDFRIYDMEVIATDKGTNFLSGHCKLTILVTDMNDNHPELSIKSFQSPIKEDIAVDTVIAVVSVSDKDSGENGKVDIHIADQLPFALRESSGNYYELVVSEPLDREKVPEYDITFTVTDRGFPSSI
ncbi:unnamed protein product [Coregonus sp. 'balchen']|nr:unnamed protein product [Coregonus sp. 'balchen']